MARKGRKEVGIHQIRILHQYNIKIKERRNEGKELDNAPSNAPDDKNERKEIGMFQIRIYIILDIDRKKKIHQIERK